MNDAYPVPKGKCPFCGAILDAASDYVAVNHPDAKRPPTTGDICVCLYCAEILEYEPEGTLQQATLKNLVSLTQKDHAMLEKTQKWIREKRPKSQTQ